MAKPSQSTEGDTCLGFAIVAGLLALFCLAPHMSLQAIGGESGNVAAGLAALFLTATALAAFIPVFGAVVGFQWSLYLLWASGYFDLVNGLVEAMGAVADPNTGIDGFALSVVMLAVMLVLGALLYLLVPVAVGAAGALLVNSPALLVRRARAADPIAAWSAGEQQETGEFDMPRWIAPDGRDAQRSFARRRTVTSSAMIVYWALLPAALFFALGTALTPTGRLMGLAAVIAAAAVAAWVQLRISEAILADKQAWAVADDEFAEVHRRTVAEAEVWARAAHPDDLSSGRAVVAELLGRSARTMHRAQQLVATAKSQSRAAGPGWVPPAQVDLEAARAELRKSQSRMASLRKEAQRYRRDRHEERQRAEARRRREQAAEAVAVVSAALSTYERYYGDTWALLQQHGAAAGLPDPGHLASGTARPAGVEPAELSQSVELLLAEAHDQLGHRGTPEERLGELAHRLSELESRLRTAAALTAAATTRLSLVGHVSVLPSVVGDDAVTDLIDQIRARSEAEAEIDEFFERTP